MKQIDLEPHQVRKSEPAPKLAIAWWVICYVVLTALGLAATNWDIRIAVAFQLPAALMGYLVAKRFRVDQTQAGRYR
ncbi:MAG: hypothetical protein RLZZ09_954 [Pseudomonadota bacterium]|jgi:hypothetical protein